MTSPAEHGDSEHEDAERELAELEALAAAPAPRSRVLTRRRLLLLQAPLLLLLAFVLFLWGRGAPSEASTAAPAKVGMRDPYLTPPASASGPVYAYVTIRNSGGSADRLVSISTPWAASAALQDAKGAGQPWVTVPAGGSVELKPGGYRIALTQLKRTPKLHDTIQLDLSFAESGTVHVWAPVGPASSLTVEDVMHAMKYMDRLPPE